ncbi:hypothetical protein RJ639_012396 [Escallonia herrerae]|uniref:Uncharacterized protein n=1 Tax=Escallonia herrerae TaxID=1293975 RepID=A0AA88VNG6_9ASTE|nr:hypothetical protein RJ639_012396 [Escallonia herrerae]
MGCFLGCFGSKDQKRRKQRYKVVSRDQNHGNQKPLQITQSPEQGIVTKHITEKPINLVSEWRDKPEEQLSLSSRKKVTFDTNVTTYEHVKVYESTDSLLDTEKISETEKEESCAKSSLSQSHSRSEDDSVTSSVGSYPPNHRYQNCHDSDDEVELEYENSDLDDEDDGDYDDYDSDTDDRLLCQEVWSESISTLPIGLRKQEVKTTGPLNQNARDRSIYVHPVLNPVENLTQWKAMKSKGAQALKSQKENFAADQETSRMSCSSEPTIKQQSRNFRSQFHREKSPNQEISVDASLSNWLVLSEITPNKKTSSTGLETISSGKNNMSQGSNSALSFEDRPILGALTVEELKQFSASSSPRKSPSRSQDEMPIIGTVGTYWSHTSQANEVGSVSSYKGIPNTTSKYREVLAKIGNELAFYTIRNKVGESIKRRCG